MVTSCIIFVKVDAGAWNLTPQISSLLYSLNRSTIVFLHNPVNVVHRCPYSPGRKDDDLVCQAYETLPLSLLLKTNTCKE
jgi:hypothetical protein